MSLDDLLMSLEYFYVPIGRYLTEHDDEAVANNTTLLDKIRGIVKPTMIKIEIWSWPDRYIDIDWSEQESMYERLRLLLYVISESENIVCFNIDFEFVNIPGSLIAEWLNNNQFVTTINVRFRQKNQLDMNLLCDALKRDTTINNIIIRDLPNKKTEFLLLAKALRGKKGLNGIQFDCRPLWAGQQLAILKNILSPESHICRLELDNMLYNGHSSVDFSEQIEKLISENSSLSTLKLRCDCSKNDDIVPILRGVINSDITDFDFSARCRIPEEQHERFQVIAKMTKLRRFHFYLNDFETLSTEIVSSGLKAMKSLDILVIKLHNDDSFDVLQGIIQDMRHWEQQCKLNLKCFSIKIELLPLLKHVKLTKISCGFVSHRIFNEFTEQILYWRYITDISFYFNQTVKFSNLNKSEFADVIFKNGTLKNISISNGSFGEQVQNKVDQVLARNKQLIECKSNPDNISLAQWPEFFEMAEPTGLNFSYECIRKMPEFFVSAMRSADKQEKPSSVYGDNRFHNKREASFSDGHRTAKRAQKLT